MGQREQSRSFDSPRYCVTDELSQKSLENREDGDSRMKSSQETCYIINTAAFGGEACMGHGRNAFLLCADSEVLYFHYYFSDLMSRTKRLFFYAYRPLQYHILLQQSSHFTAEREDLK